MGTQNSILSRQTPSCVLRFFLLSVLGERETRVKRRRRRRYTRENAVNVLLSVCLFSLFFYSRISPSVQIRHHRLRERATTRVNALAARRRRTTTTTRRRKWANENWRKSSPRKSGTTPRSGSARRTNERKTQRTRRRSERRTCLR